MLVNFFERQRKCKKYKILLLNVFLIIIFLFLVYYFLSAPFGNKDVIIHIKKNQSISSVFDELESKRVIRNSLTAKIFLKLLKNEQKIIAGDYLFKKNSPIWIVVLQLSKGQNNIEPIKVTIKEGLNNEEIANLFVNKLSVFDKVLFLDQTLDKQGYLFPDTYFLYQLDTNDEIIEKLSNNFKNKIKDIDFGEKEVEDIIIMASILEGEAKGKEDIGIISGILWKRISINMPLQVDVDRTTYEKKGLPDKPINNPGLNAIMASLNPINSPYLYYLHDKNGKVYYAKSYNEHINNINKYLR